MKRVIIFGAGKIGISIQHLLKQTGDYALTMADSDAIALARCASEGTQTVCVDVNDTAALHQALADQDYVLNATPYFLSSPIAAAAKEMRVHYFDLTEDVETTRQVRQLAESADTAFVPQCGLAPGFISIVANHLCQQFDSLDSVSMRVGALPQYPTNRLKYNLTWSTDGLINEYCNPCEAVHNGKLQEVLPLEGYERFSLDGVEYEAFNTSGGLGSLCESYAGKVKNLNYKTVRYTGHRELMKMLIEEFDLANRRALLKDMLEHSVPVTYQDVVLVFVTVSGKKDGRLVQKSFSKKIYDKDVDGTHLSAIQLTTASGICAMMDMHAHGLLPATGFIKQEQVSLDAFLENRFGKNYR